MAPPSTSLRRALTLLVPGLAVALAAVVVAWWYRAPLVARATRGIDIARLERDAQRWATDPPKGSVRGVLFGDSLTLSLGWLEYGRGQPGVAVLLRKALKAEGVPVEILNLAHPSFRPLHLAYFLDQVLAGRPRFLVTDLNLRLLAPTWKPGPGMRFEQLSRRLSLLRQLALWPWLRADGVGVLDPTVYRLQEALSLLYVSDGARITGRDWLDAQASHAETELGLAHEASRARAANEDVTLYASDVVDSPSVALLRELDRELAAAGVWTLYYVSPLNPAVLAEPDMPSADELDARVRRLQAALGVPPERFMDLHAALPASDFLDRDNHLRPSGLRRVADRLLPRLRPIIGR